MVEARLARRIRIRAGCRPAWRAARAARRARIAQRVVLGARNSARRLVAHAMARRVGAAAARGGSAADRAPRVAREVLAARELVARGLHGARQVCGARGPGALRAQPLARPPGAPDRVQVALRIAY